MSDETEVTPLRLKRATPAAKPVAAEEPPPAVVPSPVLPPVAKTEVPPPEPSRSPPVPSAPSEMVPNEPAPEKLRRRPSLSVDSTPATPSTQSAAPIPELPAIMPEAPAEKVIPVMPPQEPQGTPAAELHAASAAAPVKLRMAVKAPIMPAPPPAPMTEKPFATNLPGGAPLMPLPGGPPLPPLPAFNAAETVGARPASLPPPMPPGANPIPVLPVGMGGSNPMIPHPDALVRDSGFSSGGAPLAPLPMGVGAMPMVAAPFPGMPAGAESVGAGDNRNAGGGAKPLPKFVKPKSSHARRDLMIFVLLFVLLVAGGGGAYFYFTKPAVAEGAIAKAKDKLEQASKLPGKAIDDAKQAMAGANGKEQARVDAIANGQDVPEGRAIDTPPPGKLMPAVEKPPVVPDKGVVNRAPALPPPPPVLVDPAVASSLEAPVPTAASADAEVVRPAPSARFVRYADALKVSGVFQGSPARALVDGRLVREGDVVDPVLGVRFKGVDADEKQLILEDATTAQVRVKY